jgi:predicted transcriptional regulator
MSQNDPKKNHRLIPAWMTILEYLLDQGGSVENTTQIMYDLHLNSNVLLRAIQILQTQGLAKREYTEKGKRVQLTSSGKRIAQLVKKIKQELEANAVTQ